MKHQIKKGLGFLLALAMAVSLCMGAGATAFAADSAAALAYDLTADGKDSVTAETGDVITVTFSIRRTNSGDDYSLVGFQNEIIYDQTFFEYVEGSAATLKNGVTVPLFQTRISGQHILKSSFSAQNGVFAAQEDICSFQLRVKGIFGSGTVSCSEAMAFDRELKQVDLEERTLTVALESSSGTVEDGGATVIIPGGDSGTMEDAPSSGDGGTTEDAPSSGDGGTTTDPSSGDGGTTTDPSSGDSSTTTDPSSGDSGTITNPSGGGGTSIKVPVLVVDDMAVIEDNDIPLAGEITGVESLPVEVNLSGVEAEVNTLVLPLETAQVIARKAEECKGSTEVLRVVLKTGTMTFDKEALDTLLERATGNDLRFHLERVEFDNLNSEQQSALQADEVHAAFDAYVTSNDIRITDLQNGAVTVSVPFAIPVEHYDEGFSVWYVGEDGTLEALDASFDNGTAVWTVSRFSNYVIRYIRGNVPSYLRCAKDESCPISAFEDADAAEWYHDGVHYALENKLMEGFSKTTFAPEDNTTRAQLVTILYRLEGSPKTEDSTFRDVESDVWYTAPIGWAAVNEIVHGYSKDAFGPDDPLTREQMATILYNYAAYKGFDVTASANLDRFQDASHVSDYAENTMSWAVAEGLVEGIENNMLSPEGPATRAQAATILLRFHRNVTQ